MYIQGMAQQTQVFLLCVGFGFIMGAVYDVVRFLRKSFFCGYKAVVVQDILFFIICTLATFIFMLCTNDGELRMYPYLGCLGGFFVWYFTLGIIINSVFNKLSGMINKNFRRLYRHIKSFCQKTVKKIKKITNKISKPLEKSIDVSV